MCDLYADEVAEFWRRSWRRAKKEHRCQGCRKIINPGDRYEVTFTVFEGEAHNSKACGPCAKAIDKFGKEHSYYPDAFGFAEYLNDCIDDGDEDSKRWRPMRNALNRRIAEGQAERAGSMRGGGK